MGGELEDGVKATDILQPSIHQALELQHRPVVLVFVTAQHSYYNSASVSALLFLWAGLDCWKRLKLAVNL